MLYGLPVVGEVATNPTRVSYVPIIASTAPTSR